MTKFRESSMKNRSDIKWGVIIYVKDSDYCFCIQTAWKITFRKLHSRKKYRRYRRRFEISESRCGFEGFARRLGKKAVWRAQRERSYIFNFGFYDRIRFRKFWLRDLFWPGGFWHTIFSEGMAIGWYTSPYVSGFIWYFETNDFSRKIYFRM